MKLAYINKLVSVCKTSDSGFNGKRTDKLQKTTCVVGKLMETKSVTSRSFGKFLYGKPLLAAPLCKQIKRSS